MTSFFVYFSLTKLYNVYDIFLIHNYIYQKQVKNSVKSEEKFFNNRYLDDYVEVIINKKIALGAILGGNGIIAYMLNVFFTSVFAFLQ